jgi:NFU1 iron-sulfur cluster scaffold homolog, mitochondrial
MVIEIYTEYTPNPESLKFVANRMLLPDNSVDFREKESVKNAPLAEALFNQFRFVKGVFISNNFVTITKNNSETEWIEIVPEVKQFLKQYLSENKPVVTATESKSSEPMNATDLESKIISVLDTYVRPAVEMDGGNIRFKSYNEGIVTVMMQGSCSGCPSSTLTLKSGIEGLLKRMVPEVKEVVAEAE